MHFRHKLKNHLKQGYLKIDGSHLYPLHFVRSNIWAPLFSSHPIKLNSEFIELRLRDFKLKRYENSFLHCIVDYDCCHEKGCVPAVQKVCFDLYGPTELIVLATTKFEEIL